VEEIRAFGRFPERKAIYRHYGNREIRNPVDKRSIHFGIANSRIPIRRKAPLCGGQLTSYRDIRDSKDKVSMHFDIRKSETLIGDKIAVTGIVVIWARSLARRANA
jgi:hypothetical protein